MNDKRKTRSEVVGGGVLAAALFWASATYGQNLGDVARQERERRQSELQSTHVYTNEDLKRERILVPADRERAFAARKSLSAPEIESQVGATPDLPLSGFLPPVPDADSAFAQDALELEAILAAPRPERFVAHKVKRIDAPRIQETTPALPVVAALLPPPIPAEMIEHFGTNRWLKLARTAKPAQSEPVFVVLQAPNLPVTAAARPSSPSIETVDAGKPEFALAHAEKAAPVQLTLVAVHAPVLPVEASFMPTHAPIQTSECQQVKPEFEATHTESAPAELHFADSNAPALPLTGSSLPPAVLTQNFASPQFHRTASADSSAPAISHLAAVRLPVASRAFDPSIRHDDLKPSVALVHFEKTASRTVQSTSSSNMLLASSDSDRAVQRRVAAHLAAIVGKIASSERVSIRAASEAESQVVRVEHGDSLWKLAKEHLGSGARWHELAELNPEISDPGFIRVGDMIRLPEA